MCHATTTRITADTTASAFTAFPSAQSGTAQLSCRGIPENLRAALPQLCYTSLCWVAQQSVLCCNMLLTVQAERTALCYVVARCCTACSAVRLLGVSAVSYPKLGFNTEHDKVDAAKEAIVEQIKVRWLSPQQQHT
jgi:hypothetical protein